MHEQGSSMSCVKILRNGSFPVDIFELEVTLGLLEHEEMRIFVNG